MPKQREQSKPSTRKVVVFTIEVALPAETMIDGSSLSILDELRQYGSAEIIDVNVREE